MIEVVAGIIYKNDKFLIAQRNFKKDQDVYKRQILDVANRNLITNIDFKTLKDYLPYAVEFNTQNLKTASLPGSVPDLSLIHIYFIAGSPFLVRFVSAISTYFIPCF